MPPVRALVATPANGHGPPPGRVTTAAGLPDGVGRQQAVADLSKIVRDQRAIIKRLEKRITMQLNTIENLKHSLVVSRDAAKSLPKTMEGWRIHMQRMLVRLPALLAAGQVDTTSLEIFQQLLATAFDNMVAKPNGHRYCEESHRLAVALYQRSPAAFNLIQEYLPTMFPAPTTVQRNRRALSNLLGAERMGLRSGFPELILSCLGRMVLLDYPWQISWDSVFVRPSAVIVSINKKPHIVGLTFDICMISTATAMTYTCNFPLPVPADGDMHRALHELLEQHGLATAVMVFILTPAYNIGPQIPVYY
jgi:hypothetical protein